MPLTDQVLVNSYTGNGVTTVFAYAFKIWANTDLKVTVDGVLKTLTTDYTVSGVGADGGGSVTFVAAPASLSVVTISSEVAYSRATDYQENGDLLAGTLDNDLDKNTRLIQQIRRDVKRAVKLPIEETDDKGILTVPATRANKVMAFDSAGAPVAKTPTEMLATMTTVGDGLELVSGDLKVKFGEDFKITSGEIRSKTAINIGDFSTIQAALDSADAGTGRIYRLPPPSAYQGVTTITAPLTCPGANFKIEGIRGRDSVWTGTTIKASGAIASLLNLVGSDFYELVDFRLDGNATATAGLLLGLNSGNAAHVKVSGLTIQNISGTAIDTAAGTSGGLVDVYWDRIIIETATVGIDHSLIAGNIVGGAIAGCTEAGIRCNPASTLNMNGTVFSGNGIDIKYMGNDAVGTQTFNGVWFENSTVAILKRPDVPSITKAVSSIAFNDCHFHAMPGANALLDFTNMEGTHYIRGGAWDSAGHGTVVVPVNVTLIVESRFADQLTYTGAGTVIKNPAQSGLPGSVVQVVNYQTGAYATGSTAMVYDDTIPQNTEGNEYMTLAITPKATTNKLIIEADGVFYAAGADRIIMALFQDTTAGALAATVTQVDPTSAAISNTAMHLSHYMTAGTVSPTTFKIRAGRTGAAALAINGDGSRKLGGVSSSSITITEVKAS